MILSHVNCFIQGEIIGFQVLLDSLHPRSTMASWWFLPVCLIFLTLRRPYRGSSLCLKDAPTLKVYSSKVKDPIKTCSKFASSSSCFLRSSRQHKISTAVLKLSANVKCICLQCWRSVCWCVLGTMSLSLSVCDWPRWQAATASWLFAVGHKSS